MASVEVGGSVFQEFVYANGGDSRSRLCKNDHIRQRSEMDDSDGVTLWRPVGPRELELVVAAAMRAFPPRLPEQPIFYPVLTEAYATKIARDWNAPRGGGYVTKFRVRRSFLARYEVQEAGGREHLEYWIPSEDLPAFNAAILGEIEVVSTFPPPKGKPRRLDVELFIVHPTLAPSEITAALGLEAKFTHRAGDQRKTPSGTLLQGFYPDTRWRHTRRFTISDQWFAKYVEDLVEYLGAYQQFLHDIRATGGKATLIVQWLGDGYFGDSITRETLAKLVQLELDLGMECYNYTVPESA